MKATIHNNDSLPDKLIRAYQFDFNKYIKNGPTFEEKVMKENANDLGLCTYSPQTTHIMITEFKKFMAVNATLIVL